MQLLTKNQMDLNILNPSFKLNFLFVCLEKKIQ